MTYASMRDQTAHAAYYRCSNYGQGLHRCTQHYIRYDALYQYVLSRLQYWTQQIKDNQENLLQQLIKSSTKQRRSSKHMMTNKLKQAEKRKIEVDRLFVKIYEDWSMERITEYNFNMLSEENQKEQNELNDQIQQLKEEFQRSEQNALNAEKWIECMKRYEFPTELTAELLNAVIEKILIHEAVKNEDGSKLQKIEIHYRFIGAID